MTDTHIIQEPIPRYPQHTNAIHALLKLRSCYLANSPEYRAVDAMCETVNRLGGVRTTTGISALIPTVSEMRRGVADGLAAVVEYMRKA